MNGCVYPSPAAKICPRPAKKLRRSCPLGLGRHALGWETDLEKWAGIWVRNFEAPEGGLDEGGASKHVRLVSHTPQPWRKASWGPNARGQGRGLLAPQGGATAHQTSLSHLRASFTEVCMAERGSPGNQPSWTGSKHPCFPQGSPRLWHR